VSCRACGGDVETVYEAPTDRAFTSSLVPIATIVRIGVCRRCGHAMTLDPPPPEFYTQTYDLLLGSDDEDDLFDVGPYGPIYRQQIELANLEALVAPTATGAILDYGCGKGGFLRRFCAAHPRWSARGFEASERYRTIFERTNPHARLDVGTLGDGTFDLVVMFQVLEHLEDPHAVLVDLRARLPGGVLFVTVPSLHAYSVDLFIADHLSHFTPATLDLLLARAGFTKIVGSETCQSGQITAAYRAEAAAVTAVPDRGKIVDEIVKWTDFANRARAFVATHPRTIVYGAGAAGTYLALACDGLIGFFDRNPFKQGKPHLGLPVYAPDAPVAIDGVIAALGPARARRILEDAGLVRRGIEILYP
jgi:SAM-dependent methyltransferase